MGVIGREIGWLEGGPRKEGSLNPPNAAWPRRNERLRRSFTETERELTRHLAALLEPKDGAKGAREENTLHRGKRDLTQHGDRKVMWGRTSRSAKDSELSIHRSAHSAYVLFLALRDHPQPVVDLLPNAWNGLDRLEQPSLLAHVLLTKVVRGGEISDLDVRVDQETVHFGVDVLHGQLRQGGIGGQVLT